MRPVRLASLPPVRARTAAAGLVLAVTFSAACSSAPPAPPAPAPPAARPAPTRTVPPPPPPRPPAPPAVLSPQAPPEEERRLVRVTNENIAGAEQILKQIDSRRLSSEQQDTAQTIRSFIAKARDALGTNDVGRAATLADKARVLADELGRSVR